MTKVIIIGATSGIGRELAIIYAKKGYFVGISGRRNELLLSLQNKFPKNIVTECFDVTQRKYPSFAKLDSETGWP
jgi:NADP-dependent 3-hydroxy acid dehydrogenase YdfG